MIDDERPRNTDEGGGGGWIMTFADLMTLLMCFFVLLLSFAELDVMKFKAIAGSMRLAFGVQRDIKAIEVPKGTSIIAQEFSSSTPDPSVINEVRQQTTDEDKQTLEFTDALVNETDGEDPEDSDGGTPQELEQTEGNVRRLVEALKNEIEEGMIQIETQGTSIVIRIREKGSFPSGTASFDPAFLQVLTKLRDSMQGVEGTIAVAGHTDNIPIKTSLYRSNWDLSSARAVSVVHALLEEGNLEPQRFVVEGHGDAHPLVPNDTAENRSQNRRVEITIRQGQPDIDAVEKVAAYAVPESDETPASQAVEDVSAEPIEKAEPAMAEQARKRPATRLDLIRKGMEGE
jgi:chemotaxis protein MotB